MDAVSKPGIRNAVVLIRENNTHAVVIYPTEEKAIEAFNGNNDLLESLVDEDCIEAILVEVIYSN